MPPIDDDDVPPRRRAVMDEVAEIHAAEAAGLPVPAVSTAPPISPPPPHPPPPPPPPPPSAAPALSGGLGSPLGGGLGSPASSGLGTAGSFGSPSPTFGNASAQGTNPATAGQPGNAASYFGQTMADAEGKEPEHWVKAFWRPAMGWLYMLINLMDFVVFPAIAMFLPVIMRGVGIQMQYVAWQSITLSNGGLIHLAFGAILGVSAWSRGQEKLQK